MTIYYSKEFKAAFKERISKDERLVREFQEAVEQFKEDPTSPSLHDHQLEDKMQEFRAFAINKDYRVIYFIKQDDICIFVDIGGHDDVYYR
jgi:addiction module RelE/StbE family toxin